MPRVAIYARKSSESDDKQAKSIEEQLAWARTRCTESLGERHAAIYQEARSARRPGRPEFGRLMEAVWRGEIDTIVTWKADRLARNPVDGGNVQHALMEGKVVIVTSDRRYAEPDDQFLLNLEFGFSTKYSQDLSKNVSRGLANKLEHGEWTGLAPLGYLNVSSERERRRQGGTIIVDPETAPYVQKLFALCARGDHSLRELTAKAIGEWRLNFRRSGDTRAPGRYPMSTIAHILKNPFYYGAMRIKGKLYRAVHEPLISRSTFDTVQRVLAGRRMTAERPSKHAFPFSALIVCGLCGHRFTAYTKVKPSGRTYTYYRCARGSKGCPQPHIAGREIEAIIRPLLQSVTLTQAERDQCIAISNELTRDGDAFLRVEAERIRAKRDDVERRAGRLLDLLIDGAIGKEEKDVKARELAEERTSLDLQLRELERGDAGLGELFEGFLASLTDAENVFDSAEADEQRALLRALEIELSATPDQLLLNAGNATALVKKRGESPIWRTLIQHVRTELSMSSRRKVPVASRRLQRRGKRKSSKRPAL